MFVSKLALVWVISLLPWSFITEDNCQVAASLNDCLCVCSCVYSWQGLPRAACIDDRRHPLFLVPYYLHTPWTMHSVHTHSATMHHDCLYQGCMSIRLLLFPQAVAVRGGLRCTQPHGIRMHVCPHG